MRILILILVVIVGYMTVGTLQVQKNATVIVRLGNELSTYKGDFSRNFFTGTYSVMMNDGSTFYFDKANFVGATWAK